MRARAADTAGTPAHTNTDPLTNPSSGAKGHRATPRASGCSTQLQPPRAHTTILVAPTRARTTRYKHDAGF